MCSVDGCHSVDGIAGRDITFFTVPLEKEIVNRWTEISDYPFKSGQRICSEHFTDTDFIYPANNKHKRKLLKKGAIPSIMPAEYLGKFCFRRCGSG